jgi:hypothetical protein
MRRLLVLPVVLAVAVAAPTVARAVEPKPDQQALEAAVNERCGVRTAKEACAPADLTELTISWLPDERWHVDWLETFATMARDLNGKEPEKALPRLDEARRYAVERNGLLAFQQLQTSHSCRGPRCPRGGRWQRVTPSVNAISHGAALRSYLRGWLLTRDVAYAQTVSRLLDVFETPTKRGGVRTRGVAGTHFALYSYDPDSLVFNNFVASVDALLEVALSPHPDWERARDLVMQSIGEIGAEFDINGRCDPSAYNVVRDARGRWVADRGEDVSHIQTSIAQLEAIVTRIDRAGRVADQRLSVPHLYRPLFRGMAQWLRQDAGRVPERNKRDCIRRRRSYTELHYRGQRSIKPARLDLHDPETGKTYELRGLRWRDWGRQTASATARGGMTLRTAPAVFRWCPRPMWRYTALFVQRKGAKPSRIPTYDECV